MVSSGVADKLEQEYSERKLGGSCYLFRMDDDSIADATLRGSCARFINHSNAPNCDSRVITNAPDGRKRIVIQTLREVYPGEEITYDYKFPFDFAKE
jgi:SET domain-containing protein